MTEQNKPKNLGITIFVIVAVIVAGAAFLISRKNVIAPTIDNPSGLEVIESGDQKIIRNNIEGLEVVVPKDWIIDNTNKQFYSSLDEKTGCKISTHIEYIEIDMDDLKQELDKNIQDEQLSIEKIEYNEIKIGDFNALKQTLKTLEWGNSVRVYILGHNKLYSFVMSMPESNIKECTDYMNDFISKIIIK